MDAVPTLVGVAGHVDGAVFPLEYGKKVVVGRSRSADWSLVGLESWTSKSQEEQENDHAFRTVSGKHFEITMFNLGSIELVNISSNGTRLDGKTVDRTTITDVATNSHEIGFGADEILRLELREGQGEGTGTSKAGAALKDTLGKLSGDEGEKKDEGSETRPDETHKTDEKDEKDKDKDKDKEEEKK